MTATATERPATPLNAPDLIRRVNALRQIDNRTNWFYLAREYLFLGLVVGLALWCYHWRMEAGLSWWWDVPVTVVAIVLVGAGQHRLSTLAHEASHYMLFRNRVLNELASDWLCMFPMWSTTHHYRLQHLAHHQFPNDPERDPDLAQMEASGHRFDFPMAPRRFVWELVKQFLWLPKLIRYIRVRARYNSTGGGSGPYEAKGPRSKVLILVGLLYLAALAGALMACVLLEQPLFMGLVPAAMLTAILIFYAVVPLRLYRQTTVRADVSPRWMTFGRVTYLTASFTALAWLTYLTGNPWALWYIVLWMVPLGTTFAFFMILRQVVQHGNATRERLTNTRIFLVGRLIRFAVFPLGMDYHLPHHLFPMVPHYRLKELHNLLLEAQEYRDHATVVEGYFFHHRPPQHPTVLELMAAPAQKA
ncbi:MAG: fatty acid desaturase [Gemmataceae bacterium]|nr:fatty acid desaturase [Gemmataceae bacterium]